MRDRLDDKVLNQGCSSMSLDKKGDVVTRREVLGAGLAVLSLQPTHRTVRAGGTERGGLGDEQYISR